MGDRTIRPPDLGSEPLANHAASQKKCIVPQSGAGFSLSVIVVQTLAILHKPEGCLVANVTAFTEGKGLAVDTTGERALTLETVVTFGANSGLFHRLLSVHYQTTVSRRLGHRKKEILLKL